MSGGAPETPRTAATPSLNRLISLAAYFVRLEDGCETGHRAGTWHLHQEPVIEAGRLIASLVKDAREEARAEALREVGELRAALSECVSSWRDAEGDLITNRMDLAAQIAIELLSTPSPAPAPTGPETPA